VLARARGFGELVLAQLQRGALRQQGLAPQPAFGGLGRFDGHGGRRGNRHRLGRRAAGGGDGLDGRLIAFLRAPAHTLFAQRADGGDLSGRADLEAAQREWMRHPATVEMHEHADAQLRNVDQRW